MADESLSTSRKLGPSIRAINCKPMRINTETAKAYVG